MKTPEEILIINAEYYSTLFQLVAKCGIVDTNTFEIKSESLNHQYLPNLTDGIDVRTAAPFKDMFRWLKHYDAFPCLYRWEIISPDILSKELVETIKNEVKSIKENTTIQTPRTVKYAFPKDNTLYVGKSDNIVSRIMNHLGYHEQTDQHGLHLDMWAGNHKMVFKLHVYVFPQECKPIMELFERSLAEIHPSLIGTH
jgi:hypothetical protein